MAHVTDVLSPPVWRVSSSATTPGAELVRTRLYHLRSFLAAAGLGPGLARDGVGCPHSLSTSFDPCASKVGKKGQGARSPRGGSQPSGLRSWLPPKLLCVLCRRVWAGTRNFEAPSHRSMWSPETFIRGTSR